MRLRVLQLGFMLQFILALLAAVGVFFRSRNDTALEILACGSNSSFSSGNGHVRG
jgi:hypothetical protein